MQFLIPAVNGALTKAREFLIRWETPRLMKHLFLDLKKAFLIIAETLIKQRA